ncbi:MAG: hypothetical protein CL878_02075 [Dehalococcoidia bacterium]|nr:hypothetical protein [Dehalococcoidia bacterium]
MRRVLLFGGLGLVGGVLVLVIGVFVVFAIIARPRGLLEPGIAARGAPFDPERALPQPGGPPVLPRPPTTRGGAPAVPSRPQEGVPSALPATRPQTNPVAAFAAKVAPAAGVYAQALTLLDNLGAQAGQEPSLLRDQEWRAQATFALKMMELASEDMASIQPVPPELKRTASLLQQVKAETKPMVTDYAQAIEAEDRERIATAAERLDKINEYLLEAAEDMRQAATQ